jgi:hypothetical protein
VISNSRHEHANRQEDEDADPGVSGKFSPVRGIFCQLFLKLYEVSVFRGG